MTKLIVLPLEVQGWDSCVMVTLLFSSQGWQSRVSGLQCPAAKDQVVMAGPCIAGSCGGGRKLTTDGKWFSLKLLDLSLILNVTCRGPCSFALMWHCFSCSNANWRSIWGLGVPEAKAAPWPFYYMWFFLTIPPHCPALLFSSFSFFLPF